MKSLKFAKHLSTRIILIAVFLLPLIAGFTTPALAEDDGGNDARRIYTMTNSASGNEVVEIRRAMDGSPSLTSYSTGGLGSGPDLARKALSFLLRITAGSLSSMQGATRSRCSR